MAESLDVHCEHFNPVEPETVRDLWPIMTHIRETCPVAHSDAQGGFWSLTRYADVAGALQEWETFSSGQGTVWPRHGEMELMDLIEQDPPLHREWRRIFNPFFTPAKVAETEPLMRKMTTEHIDAFIEDGVVDISKDFAHVLPGTIFFKIAFSMEDDDLTEVHDWLRYTIQEIGPETAEAHANWVSWLKKVLSERRDSGVRKGDMLDAVLDPGRRQRTFGRRTGAPADAADNWRAGHHPERHRQHHATSVSGSGTRGMAARRSEPDP